MTSHLTKENKSEVLTKAYKEIYNLISFYFSNLTFYLYISPSLLFLNVPHILFFLGTSHFSLFLPR